MKRTIDWVFGSGNQFILSVQSRYELDMQGREKTSGRLEVVTSGTIDGVEIPRYRSEMEQVNHPVAVAKFGSVGLTQINYDRWQAAYDDIALSIEDHNTKCDRHAAELDKFSDESKKMERDMAHGELEMFKEE